MRAPVSRLCQCVFPDVFVCTDSASIEASEQRYHVILHYLSHSNRLHMVKSWIVNM